MPEDEEWQVFSWHCVNCGHVVHGLKNKEGKIKVECSACHAVMVRTPKGRRTDDFHVTAPKQENAM